jgi:hypothetical protein
VPEVAKKPWLCGQAWGSLVLQADNRVKPCCRYAGSWEAGDGSANSAPFRQLREEMLAGTVPAGCQKCLDEEKTGIQSKRQRSGSLLPPAPVSARSSSVDYLEINLSSLCNLRCLMCSPDRSSGWNRDAAAAGYEAAVHNDNDLEIIRHHLRGVKTISLLGGETFLGPRLDQILDLIMSETDPAGVELVLSTNLTLFPQASVLDKLARFKEVDIGCSIDAVGERNNYIRFPSDWRQVEENFFRFRSWAEGRRNILLRLDATISAYSFGGLPALLEWWKEAAPKKGKGPQFVCLNPVTTPEFQSVHALSREVRESVAAQIRSRPDLHFGNVKDSVAYSLHEDRFDLRERLHGWTERIDRARGVSARLYAPEIYA